MLSSDFLYRWKQQDLLRTQRRLAANPNADCHQWLGERKAALLQVCIVMMIKDEADIIYENLAWHRRLGFAQFVILDNGSNDSSRAKLLEFRAQFLDIELLIVEDIGVGYFQGRKTTGLSHLAKSIWPWVRWIFPLDADEFICVRDNLADVMLRLESVKATVACISLIDHRALIGSVEVETRPFYLHQSYQLLNVSQLKVAFRALDIREVEMGNHGVAFNNSRRRLANGLDIGIAYRHFSVRSIAHLRRKIINGGIAYASTDYSEGIGRHWREWHRRYKENGDVAIHTIYEEMKIPLSEAVYSPFPLNILIQES